MQRAKEDYLAHSFSLEPLWDLKPPYGTRAWVFQSREAGEYTLRIDAVESFNIYRIRIEEFPDTPDSASSANRLEFIGRGFGTSSSPQMEFAAWKFEAISPGDVDWYVVPLDAKKQYEFSLQTGYDWRNALDANFIDLKGPDGVTIASTVNAGKTLRYWTGSNGAGDYYIGVRNGSGTRSGMYIIQVRELDVGFGNNTGVNLDSGEIYLSFFNTTVDTDTYRMRLREDRLYRAILLGNGGEQPWNMRFSFKSDIKEVCITYGCTTSPTDHYEDLN